MKAKKTIAISLASFLLASSMILPASAAASSFTPNAKNFAPVFDFDSTPTDEYTVGYQVKEIKYEKIGSGRNKPCINAQDINGLTYTLSIVNGYNNSKALKLNVTDMAPPKGVWCPIALNSMYGKKTLPGIPDGYEATDFAFWIDTTKYKDSAQQIDGKQAYKGILLYFQERDYDASGNLIEKEQCTAWQVKSTKDGGHFFLEDKKGGWEKHLNNIFKDDPAQQADRSMYIPSGYRGWVKVPLSAFDYAEFSKVAKDIKDADKKIDCKKIQLVSLGVGNYESQKGAEVIFDEFGFMMKPISAATTTKAPNGTTAPTKQGDTTAAPSDTTAADTTATEASANETETTAAETTTTKTDTTAVPGSTEPKDNNHTGLIVTIIVIVVVLGGAGTGLFFFDKKVKNDGYSSIVDYFKNRKNKSEQ